MISLLFIISSFILSLWIMFHTFSYSDGTMYIATKAWSDFASHIPLIRSFSLGDNSLLEYPLFPGEPIRYHFLFYAVVGFLERIGVRLDWALNIPSALSFTFLLYMIFVFAKAVFKKTAIALLSVILFLFNGSLSFLYFFKEHPLSFPKTFSDIITNNVFPAFAPYDGSLISGGFWNLNIFTNQRHFALPLALTLLIVLCLFKNEEKKKNLSTGLAILFGFIIGIFSLLHGAVFIMSIVILLSLIIFFSRERKSIAIMLLSAFIFSLPRMFLLWHTATGLITFHPGYLLANNLTLFTWLRYWVLNLGLGFFLIPLGFFLANRQARKIFIAFSTLFIIGNLFQFSPDIATNHKFFNLWLIVGNMFTAYVLYLLWKKTLWKKIVTAVLLFFLIFSGVIDFFPIVNDYSIPIADYSKDQTVAWIMKNTPKNAVFLNTTYLYHPASLAGRKIFLGWPYFSWSLGYDTNSRSKILSEVFVNRKEDLCIVAKEYAIDYIAITFPSDEGIPVNKALFMNTKPVYTDANEKLFIYEVKNICQ